MDTSRPSVGAIDVREAARLTHRSPETVRRWIWSGRLAAHRSGRRLLIAPGDLEQLLAVGGSSESAATLTEWFVEAQSALDGASGRTHRSAADLVLADRRARA